MNAPKVSICIPTYYRIELVQRLITSILAQDFTDFEIIISDNTPGNEISDFLIRNKYEKIQYYKNQPPVTSIENWNLSISRARGDFVKIMHSDDWFTYPHSLRRYVELLDEHADASFAFSGSLSISAKTESAHEASMEQISGLRQEVKSIFIGNFIGAPSATIVRRSDIAYDTKLSWLVDIEYYIRILGRNSVFNFTTEKLVSIGIHEDQMTNSCSRDKDLLLHEYAAVYKKHNLRVIPGCHITMQKMAKECNAGIFYRLFLGRQILANLTILWNEFYIQVKPFLRRVRSFFLQRT